MRLPAGSVSGRCVALSDEADLSVLNELANLNEYPKGDLISQIARVAAENSYNPAAQYVCGQVWDGRDHVGELFNQMEVVADEDREWSLEMFRRWLRGAAGLATGEIESYEHVLVLVEQLGSAGKTRFFRKLCPPHLRKDSLLLDVSSKDSVKEAISYWLVELGEIDATFRRSDSGHLKAFLSRTEDEIRRPYSRAASKYPRRTAYFASVNSGCGFLIDGSSNRRFLPIRVNRVNADHTVNMQQVWAQAITELRNGFRHYFDRHEVETKLQTRNEAHRQLSAVADLLSEALSRATGGEKLMTVTALLKAAGAVNPQRRDVNEAAEWLRAKGYEYKASNGVRGFIVPDITTAAAFVPPGAK